MTPYVPLWVKTNGSFLEGASRAEELVDRAKELGLDTLAITDRDGVYGIVRAHVRAKEVGVRILVGAQVTLEGGARVLVLAETRAGYGAMCRMLTLGHARAPKGQSIVQLDELREAARAGLVVLVGEAALLRELARDGALEGRLYALCARHLVAEETVRERELRRVARAAAVPEVACVEVLYHEASRQPVADVLACIRGGRRIFEAGRTLRQNAEHALASDERMRALFADAPELLARTREVAARCGFTLDELRYRYPGELVPEGHDERSWLRELTFRGAEFRYDGAIPDDVRVQLERELALIEKLDYGGYFLTMWEVVEFCRAQSILCQGRGSAANSAVCYCLRITAVDPVKMDLLFERFLSVERAEPPDIDLDIEHERREEVIQWVYTRRGRRCAAMVANNVSYRSKSAIRDVGRVLGLPDATLDRVSHLLSYFDSGVSREAFERAGLDPDAPASRQLVELSAAIQGFPRHLSIHPGGFLLGSEPVDEFVPVEPATMEGRTVIQWDKYDVEALGLFKVDLLGLGCLTHLRKTLALLERHEGLSLELARIPHDDPATFEMITRGDTVGVFQIESRAQMAMLPRLRPKAFYDLVIEVAIVRPGPIQGAMVHPYLRRREGKEPVVYPHPSFERVLARTLGVPLFQEQVMKLAVVAAGYSGGEADQLRRDMASWRSNGKLERHHDRIVNGMAARGVAQDFAERLFSQIKGFGEYGFPESHAASFALLAYATAWLRRHHLAAFTCGLLNALPMGFYSASTLVEDARRHGVEVRPVDVQASGWDVRLEPASQPGRRWALRMGYRFVAGFGARERKQLEASPSPYADLGDFVRRTGLLGKHVLALAEAGAFDSLGVDRRGALWSLRGLLSSRGDTLPMPESEQRPSFTTLSRADDVTWDYERMAHSTRGHPMEAMREALRAAGLPDSSQVRRAKGGQALEYVGAVICRQRPETASGVTFYTLEDEHGFVNVVVYEHVFERFAVIARTVSPLGVAGRTRREANVVHLVADRLFVPEAALRVAPRSRSFR